MSVLSLLTQRVTIVQRVESGDLDEYGNDIPSEFIVRTNGTKQQLATSERNEIPNVTDRLFLPPGTQIDTNDVVIVGIERYEVEGDPNVVMNPRSGKPSHVEVLLHRSGDDVTAS